MMPAVPQALQALGDREEVIGKAIGDGEIGAFASRIEAEVSKNPSHVEPDACQKGRFHA
jgi:hypothetical protein